MPRAWVGVFGGLVVPVLVRPGVPYRFFPVSNLTKDRRRGGLVGCALGALS